MAETTEIIWTDHSFSPWFGCSKVSAGCDNCYGETWSKRSNLVVWGGPRRLTADATWLKVLRWYEAAMARGVVERIFPSLCDPLDPEVPAEWRERFHHLIRRTCKHLDWLLLTKRSEQLIELPVDVASVSSLGVTVESGAYAYRIADLKRCIAGTRFLSCEPLVAPLDLVPYLSRPGTGDALNRIDHVIVGGESGPHARPLNRDWVRAIRDACAATETAFMWKQGSGLHPEKLPLLDGVRHYAMPGCTSPLTPPPVS